MDVTDATFIWKNVNSVHIVFIYLFIHLFLYLFQDLLNDQIKQKRTEIDWSTMEINGMDDIKVNMQSKGTSPDQTM